MADKYLASNGSGILDDYSGLNAAGAAFQGFAEAYERAQDRQYKRLERDAQLQALKAKTERDNFENSLPQRKQKTQIELWKANRNAEFDEQGNVTAAPLDPEYAAIQRDKAEATKLDVVNKKNELAEKTRKANAVVIPGFEKTQDYSGDAVTERDLKKNFTDVKSFTDTLASLKQKVQAAKKEDLVDRTSDAYKAIQQDLTQLQLLYKNPAFAQLGVLAGPDMTLLEKVIENPGSLSNLYSGKDGVLKRYDQLGQNVQNKFNSYVGTFGLRPSAQPAGLMKKGLLGGGKMGGKSAAPAKPKTVIQNGNTYTLNEATGEYE